MTMPKRAGDLVTQLQETERKAKAKQAQPVEQPSAVIVRLPQWPDASRGVPNGLLRSALFGAIRRGPRRSMLREKIASLDGVEIIYTGQRLDQTDLTVFTALLHLARLQPLGERVRINAYQLLKLLGKTNTGGNRRVLDQQLSRLKATGVEIGAGRYSFESSLIQDVYRDKATKEYVVVISETMRKLFPEDGYTLIDWPVRQELDGKPLAQWLHAFYSTHAEPYPFTVETLYRLSGSDAESVSDWKTKRLSQALKDVEAACTNHEQAFNGQIRGNVVEVRRSGSVSQQKHARKKPPKAKNN